MQVVRIFTDMSISPSLSPRQCPDRYAFRAGRNLPDKEFRYHRTVHCVMNYDWLRNLMIAHEVGLYHLTIMQSEVDV